MRLRGTSNQNVTFKRFRHITDTVRQKKLHFSEKHSLLATNQGRALVKLISPDVPLHLLTKK